VSGIIILMFYRWCHLPLWLGQTFSVKITFSVPLLLCVLQETKEGLREAMAKDAVTLNAKLPTSHNDKSSEKHGHILAILDLDHHMLLSTPSLFTEMLMLLTMTPTEVLGTSRRKSNFYNIMSIMFHVRL
jgi:hypothetical protein